MPNTKVITRGIRVWSHSRYGGPDDDTETFEVSVDDQLESDGQIYIDMAPDGGDVDDLLSIVVEANRLPTDEKSIVQTAHVHFDNDNLAFSLFKSGKQSFLLRPECGVRLKEVLVDGQIAYQLEGETHEGHYQAL